MKQTIIKEIEDLHQFYEGWFSGKLENSDEQFEYLEKTLSANFRLIDPNGKNHHRGPLLINFRNWHGSLPNIKIEIENVVLRFWLNDLVLAIYEEWQNDDDKTTGRISTAIFRQKENTPNGLEWIQVHETWLPNNGPEK